MLKALTLAICIFTGALAFGQDTASPLATVTIKSKGDDVREVVSNLFEQAKKNFVLDSTIEFKLYLSLENLPFDEALPIVCKTAHLEYEIKNGIYYVRHKPQNGSAAATTTTKEVVVPKPLGPIPQSTMMKRVSLNLKQTDIKAVYAELAKQAGVNIDIDPKVPSYKLDAIIEPTTFRAALNQLADATGLTFKLTNNMSITISAGNSTSRITLIKDGN